MGHGRTRRPARLLRRLERHGVHVTISRYPGVIHSFSDYADLDQAADAHDEAVSFLTAAWAGAPTTENLPRTKGRVHL